MNLPGCLVALVCGAALGACAAEVAVAPGHGAVLLTPDGHFTTLGEGVTVIPDSSVVDDFDLTEQVQGGTFTAATADGLAVVVRDPVVSYGVAVDELVAADRALGPAGWRTIVAPVVQSAIARVIATYPWSQLDTPHIREAQARISQRVAAELRLHHISRASIELKGIAPKLPELANAITETSVWEQHAIEAKTRIEVAQKRADNLRAEAAGIAASYSHVAPTLDGAVLQDKHDRAWKQLITSPHATVQVVDHPSDLEVTP